MAAAVMSTACDSSGCYRCKSLLTARRSGSTRRAGSIIDPRTLFRAAGAEHTTDASCTCEQQLASCKTLGKCSQYRPKLCADNALTLLRARPKPPPTSATPAPAAAASNTRNTTMPEEIANPLPEDRCVVVVTGPIGYGKSRFIRRHLLPALHKQQRKIALLEHRFSSEFGQHARHCLLYTSPSPRDGLLSRMPSSA